jgi:mRNA-degrading endonuclease RelE of RelBE toxin-antitoxin system
MPFAIYTTPVGHRTLKKLPPDVRQHVLQQLEGLRINPLAGQKLQGKMRPLRSLHTRYKNSDYRVAYEVKEKEQAIAIWYAASRENFYKQLEKLL